MSTLPPARTGATEIPRVVGTITTLAALEQFPQKHRSDCDVAEVRLDQIGVDTSWQTSARRIEELGIPVLLTIRSVAEGGGSTLSSGEMLTVISAAWNAFSILDVEHYWPGARDVAGAAQANGKAVVVSFHDFKRTPAGDDLLQITHAAAEYGDIVKISTFVNTREDISILRGLLQSGILKPMCVIGMGPLGTETRLDFPRLGSCLTYGYLDSPAAPGQLSARELIDHLRKALPSYNAEFARKHFTSAR